MPGFGLRGANVNMQLDYADHFKADPVEAYGPLIVDAMRGDQTLFKHRIEVEGAWNAVMPFLDARSAPLREGSSGITRKVRGGRRKLELSHVTTADGPANH